MNSTSKKALSFLILSFILAFIVLLIALFFYHSRTDLAELEIIDSLKTGFIFRLALIHALQLLPPLSIFILITSFSIFFTLSPFQTKSFTYTAVMVPSYFTLLAFIALIIASEFLFVPSLTKETEGIILESRIAERAITNAKSLHANNESQRARSVLEIYLEIDPKNRDARKLHDNIMEKLYIDTFTSREEDRPIQEEEQVTSLEKGRRAYNRGNYYEALYYFERALALHGGDREIEELYRRTKGKVDTLLGELSQDEKELQRLIQQKEKAITMLEEGDYYGAYRVLSTLRKKYPELYDLELYYRSAEDELLKIDFLPQEIEEYDWLPSTDNIIFVDKQGYVNTVRKIIPWEDRFYFFDLTRYSTQGGRIEKAQWKYGKWISGRIRLKNIRDFEALSSEDAGRYYILTDLHPGYLLYFNNKDKLTEQLSIYERLTLSDELLQSGIDIQSRSVYVAQSLGIFFSVYVLSLILSGIAWSKRSIYEFPPFFKLLLFIIVAPILCYLFHRLYLDVNSIFLYTHRYVTRYFLKNLNIALYTAIINSVIAILSTIFFLSQRSEVE
jgi:tetratricopeptide (TPR) repeat protein